MGTAVRPIEVTAPATPPTLVLPLIDR